MRRINLHFLLVRKTFFIVHVFDFIVDLYRYANNCFYLFVLLIEKIMSLVSIRRRIELNIVDNKKGCFRVNFINLSIQSIIYYQRELIFGAIFSTLINCPPSTQHHYTTYVIAPHILITITNQHQKEWADYSISSDNTFSSVKAKFLA